MAEAAPVVAPEPAPAAPAPAPEPTAAPATALAPTPAPEPVKGYWPEGWQKRIAGDDEKELKQISRYASPEDVWKKAKSLEARLSSGELKSTLPKDPKPEELASWRKDNGIPEKASDYKLDGITIPERDKTIINHFLETAHGKNFTPEQAKASIESYYAMEEHNRKERVALDDTQRVAALDTLNAEWGGSFRRNINLAEGLLAKFPESVRDALKNARLPDGTAVFNSADVLKGFVGVALELNPAGVVVPASGGDVNKVALDEYKELKTFMRDKRADYNKDAGKQERMRQLIDHLSTQGIIDGNGNEVVKQAA